MGNGDMVDEASPAEPRSAPTSPGLRHRVVTVAVGLGAAAGVAVGATALAAAATAPSTTQPGSSATTVPTTIPGRVHGFGGPARRGFGPGGFGPGGFGGPGGGIMGPVVHGQYTVKGPNGYETLDERTGTVSAVTDTSGSTWSLSVKSADGTSGTFTVNSSTSVNGGESGIASVKTGDTVNVTGTVSGGTSTATQITDVTTLGANGKAWMPMRPQPPAGAPTAPTPPGGATTSSV